jgi:hypothetical protein
MVRYFIEQFAADFFADITVGTVDGGLFADVMPHLSQNL